MIWNWVLTSYRFIRNSRTFTVINLVGLVAGLTAAFILLVVTMTEISFNRYHENSDRIYRLINHGSAGETFILTPYSLAPQMKKKIPAVESIARICYLQYLVGTVSVSDSGMLRNEPGFICTDPQLLDILTLPIIRGTVTNPLVHPDHIIISEKKAKEYFGDRSPIGKTLEISINGKRYALIVAAVFSDMPWNSTLEFDFITGMDLFVNVLKEYYPDPLTELSKPGDQSSEVFFLLRKDAEIGDVASLMPKVISSMGGNPDKDYFTFQKIGDIYLNSADLSSDTHRRGNKSLLYIYASLAFFIILLAGINYSILGTARSALRFKEMGMRKVLGASKMALRGQVWTESIVLAFLAFPASFLLIGLLEPLVNRLYGYQISLYSSYLVIYIPLFASITLFIGIISGAYIAFFLASLDPLQSIKNQLIITKKIRFNQVFTVFQLVITISLMISVILIYRQVQYCMTGNYSIPKEDLVIIKTEPKGFPGYKRLKEIMIKDPEVLSVSGCSHLPGDIAVPTITTKVGYGMNDEVSLEIYRIDEGFFKTLDIPFKKGKDFSQDRASGRTMIMNDYADRKLNLDKKGKFNIEGWTLVGVISDFNMHTMHTGIRPAAFMYDPGSCRFLFIRVRPGMESRVINDALDAWKKVPPNVPMEYLRFEDELRNIYKKELLFGQAVASFSMLAFIIMGMGLFGLALLISERKMKETAIRKVYGASHGSILWGMQRSFQIQMLIAAAISVPLSWFAMNLWLKNFYYKTPLSAWIFVVSILSVAIFVSGIIFLRTLKVLRENPVNALKYE